MIRFIVCCLAAWSLTAAGAAVDAERGAITIALTQEPPNLNSTRMTDLVSFFVIGHVNEGLMRYQGRSRLVPGVAERYEVHDDRIEFFLRDDARWADGSPVTASDFVFAWRLIVDPAEAAPYAAIMYPIRNAERVQKGELPVTALGVRAEAPKHLVVELENPCGYCLNLMVHGAFYPVQQAFYEAQDGKFGAEASHLLANGPFMLTEWVHGSHLTLVKNPHYWNRDRISLNELRVGYITEDNRTRLNLFRDGSIALARLDAETVKGAVEQGVRVRTFVTGGLSFLRFNMGAERLTGDRRFREAMAAAFDADEFVNQVIAVPGYKPASSFFPSWLRGERDAFQREYPLPRRERDLSRVKALMADVRGDRGSELPAIDLLTVSSPTGVKVAEYLQGMLAESLGVTVRVDQQSFKQYIAKSQGGDFDIAISSWYPDFDDLVTYADLLASWNPNNRGGYASEEYDRVLRTLMVSPDVSERLAAADRLQRIIREDVPVLPMAETGSAYVIHPRLRGVVRRTLGADPDYTHARILAP